jgi:hypothetical protein
MMSEREDYSEPASSSWLPRRLVIAVLVLTIVVPVSVIIAWWYGVFEPPELRGWPG